VIGNYGVFECEKSWNVSHTLARALASVLTHQRDTSTPKASQVEMKKKKP